MEALNELIRILDRQAVVVEHVLFRLKALELVLATSGHRFLSNATEELDQSLDRLGALETMRRLVAEEIAEALGKPAEECTVTDAMRLADERQRAELLRSQLRLRVLLRELEEQTALARDHALARVAEVRAALERLSGVRGMRYGQDGIDPGRHPLHNYDEKL